MDYLTNRKQFVTINNIKKNSSTYPVKCWVPQGSVLGPLFFLVYINYLPRSLTVLKSILFADDCSAHASSPDIHRLVRDVNDYLDSLSEWFYCNKLSFNTEKSTYVIVTNWVIRKQIYVQEKDMNLLRDRT